MSPSSRRTPFAAALIDPTLATPSGLTTPPGAVQAERFAVYRNNVAVALIEALRAGFPVVNRLVGEDFFTAMARAHARHTLPKTPVLLGYGADFPAFIADFEPAAGLPYLADVARLEWLWLEAYHAADAEALTTDDLSQIARAARPHLQLAIHPSARWRAFAHPALSIWRRHQESEAPDFYDLDHRAERVLLVRPQAEVVAMELPEGGAAFLDAVRCGCTRARALTAAWIATPGLDMPTLLRRLVEAGVFCGIAATLDSAANNPWRNA